MEETKSPKQQSRKIIYKIDSDGNFLSLTPCPFWRMNNHGISDGSIYVGTMSCQSCRWYVSKDVQSRTIQCAIPCKLQARYEREHSRAIARQEEMRESIRRAIQAQSEEQSHSSRELRSRALSATVTRANEMHRATRQVINTRLNQWSRNNDGRAHNHQGTFYFERVSKGRGYYSQRWVAEITIANCRYRIRSHSYERAWAWIQNIREIYRMVERSFSWQKNVSDLALLCVEHLASVGIMPQKMLKFRSLTSKQNACLAYQRAKAIYSLVHKRKTSAHVTE